MKLLLPVTSAIFLAVSMGACKTPSKEGSALSSLSIGNVKACERTKDRIKEAYSKKELRSLAEKGHRYLVQEIAKGNKAAMITEAALRIATFQKGGDVYGQLVNKIFSGNATESELAEFNKKYQEAGGMKAAVEALRKAQKAVIAQMVADVGNGGRGPAATSSRAEAREIVREIVDWSNEMSSRYSSGERKAAPGQPSLQAEASAVRAITDTVLGEFLKANQRLGESNIAPLAEAEVAQLELAKANAEMAAGINQSNPEAKIAEIFRRFGNSNNKAVKQAVGIQTMHLLKTSGIQGSRVAEYSRQAQRMFDGNQTRYKLAEIASLEGLLNVAEASGNQAEITRRTKQLTEAVRRLARDVNVKAEYNLSDARQRSTYIDSVVKAAESARKFEMKSEMSYYRQFYERIAESARRGRERK